MNHFRSQVLIVACAAMLCFTGCHKTLELGGAYAPAITNDVGTITAAAAPDYALLAVDSSYDLAYSAALTACRIEQRNRALLQRISPDIKRQMDEVRKAVWEIDGEWAKARKAYLDNPVPANLDAIRRALAELQRWSATANALIPQEKSP